MPSTYIWPERKEQIPPGEVDAHDWGLLGSERREPVLVRRVRLDRRVVRDVDLKVLFCRISSLKMRIASCIKKKGQSCLLSTIAKNTSSRFNSEANLAKSQMLRQRSFEAEARTPPSRLKLRLVTRLLW